MEDDPLLVHVRRYCVVENLPCFNHNVTACHSHITCTNNDVLVCELDTCSCGSPCLTKSDCSACTDVVDLAGHVIHMEQHCVDSGCDCLPVPHGDDGHNGPPPPPGK